MNSGSIHKQVHVSQIKNILSVVKSSHIGKVWYWEGVYHLLRNINCHKQFWCWHVSVFPYLIPLPLCMCVCVCVSQIKKILSVVESSHIGKVWYWEEVYHLLCDTNCCMQFWCWRVSVFPYLIPLPLCVCVCVCVSQIKKILSVVESSHIGKVWYWEGVYHLVCEYIPLSHPPSPICVCVCVCVFLK